MPLVLASPLTAPPPSVPTEWGVLGVTWTGADGTTWNLTDWKAGVCLIRSGVTGLHNPRVTKWRRTSRAVPGHRLRGHRVEGRDVFWSVYVYGDGSEGWRRVYESFFNGIRPDMPGTWTVTTKSTTRTLRLTGMFDDDYQFVRDPYYVGWSVIPINLEPEQPLWVGDVVRSPLFRASVPVDFIEEPGAPTFFLSDAATSARASIQNPGDVEAWLRWTLTGPLDTVTIGVAGATAQVPFTIPAGSVLRIDTDPRAPQAVLDGVDVTQLLGLLDFAACPPGSSIPLSISFAGDGSVQASIQALHYRAF